MFIPPKGLSYDWLPVVSADKEGNSIETFERIIRTPQSKFTVASVTLMKNSFTGDKSVQSVRDLLKKEFLLNGLQENKMGDAWRFEGYQPELRRQVVIFISFEKDTIKVSNSFYRPSYGRKVALETEMWHRLYHQIDLPKYSFFKFIHDTNIISSAHAQSNCTLCAGNPTCLLLCQTANGSETSIGGLNLNGIQMELSQANGQLTAINANLSGFNNNHTQTNAAIGDFNNNLNQTNTNLNNFNTNHAQTNQQLAEINRDINQSINNVNNTVDKKADDFLKESEAWRAMTQKESRDWQTLANTQADRALNIAERMSDPNHLFKIATYSAAGAVIGATVANLAISGITSATSFLWKWASGELRDMKQEELLQEFAKAMKIYDDSAKLAQELEKSIDATLNGIALHKKFKLDNSEVLANIQKHIITTEFEIEDARRDRCVDDLVGLNQKMVEFQSLAKILDMVNPQKKMCQDLKETFRRLAEVEGILQSARPNLLKAEEALVEQKSKSQNESAKIMDKIRDGKLAKKVASAQDKQREILYKRNVKDMKKLKNSILADCEESLKKMKLARKKVSQYCSNLFGADLSNKKDFGLTEAFPSLNEWNQNYIIENFKQKNILLGLDKHRVYETQREQLFNDFSSESKRHKNEVDNLKGHLHLDPKIALDEMKAVNTFIEKLMREQAYIYSNGIRLKEAQFEEACISVNESR